MREIPLTRGMVALVDDEDFEEVSKHRWFVVEDKRCHTFYAGTNFGYGRAAARGLKMHALLMGRDPEGREIDHRNRNGLDNQRANLRWATKAQQRMNQGVRRDSKSGLKGVHLLHGRYWSATIRHEGKQFHLGYFPTANDAARAYDEKARELHGEFAYQNFPRDMS